jgi:hypothetical protein
MSVEYRGMKAGEEEAVAELLRKAFGRKKANIDHWMWKFPNRPGFSPSQIMLTFEDGELVGCLHTLPTILRFAHWDPIPSSIAGDLAILPEKRDRGYPRPMFRSTQADLEEDGRFLTYGFAPDRLAIGYYHDKLDMGWTAGIIRSYSKPLGARGISRKVNELSERISKDPNLKSRLAGINMAVQLNLGEAGMHSIVVEDGSISLVEGKVENPSVRIRCSRLLLQLLIGSRSSIWELVRSVLKRPPIIWGSPAALIRLLRVGMIARSA